MDGALHDPADPDEVRLSLYRDFRDEEVVPGSGDELPDEHVRDYSGGRVHGEAGEVFCRGERESY